MINDITTAPGIGKSDHSVLLVNFSCAYIKREEKKTIRNFRKADLDTLRKELSEVDWDGETEDKSAEETWGFIRDQINSAIHRNVPLATTSGRPGKKWMDKDTQ